MIGTYNKTNLTFNFSKSNGQGYSSNIELIVTKCLPLCEDRICSGLYTDTIGLGFRIRCVCRCHAKVAEPAVLVSNDFLKRLTD